MRSRLARPLIGPFTGLHVAGLAASLVAAAVLLSVLTAPISRPLPSALPTPGSSFFPIAPPTQGLAVGDLAPELQGTVDGRTVQLTDLDGQPIRLADLRGRPVWINFFATWCPPCQEETPVVREVFETHRRQGLAVVAISVQETSADDVRRYAETYGLDYTIGFDATSAVFKRYQAFGLPTQLFIDAEGVIRAVVNGPLSRIQAERILAPMLSGIEPSGDPAPTAAPSSSP